MARYRLTRADGRSLTFDGVASISFSTSNRVTDHPVENGATISDHIQPLPDEVTVVGLVSESPLSWQSARGGEAHVAAAIRFLQESRRELLTLSGPRIGTLSNLALTRFPYEVTAMRGLSLQVGLRRVTVAEAGSVVISVSDPVNTESADGTGTDYANAFADEVDVGSQATTEVGDDEAAQVGEDTSILQGWVDALGGG